ncbi:similar to alpha amylase [Paracholeplasma brassicae]|uniref:Similar to alpha amylase n=1 Tax=Acholeplasma brassicae TaxID=61635 RepID=U4KST3_9MOLU|nr:alpha-glucosidase [Paracholeplasma brassicae]CCV65489.1 similar to alpha amylase [Paracholeplasma brassicae]
MANDWIKESVVYQIYPLSFNDSNDDGIGDINGIKEKLPYLKNLGIDVIWLSPVYQSPMDDNGYDISNYYEINPMFGTKEDLIDLIKETHNQGMKLIMDLVLNHTSDEHVWFKEARKSKDNPYRDYYIWSDTPNDITSVFSGSAWTKEAQTGQYYFHLFSKKQPDLNWQNSALRHEIYQMINDWLDLGIDGFRLDVIDLIGKDVFNKKLSDGPYLETFLKEMYEACFKGRDILTVGEMPGLSLERAAYLTKEEDHLLSMVFQFDHISLDEQPGKGKWALKPLDLLDLKRVFKRQQEVYEKQGWGSLFWSNHDQPRAVSRYGSVNHRVLSSTMLHTLLFFQRGTPYIYQGEELGMTGYRFNLEEFKDIESINYYKEALALGIKEADILKSLHQKSRDNSRTPMQWDDTKNAGFSNGTPWIKVNPNYKEINAANEQQDKNGVYHYIKKLLQLRKEKNVVKEGHFTLLDETSSQIFSYQRKTSNETLVVICNFTNEALTYDLSTYQSYELLLTNQPITNDHCLSPYQAIVYYKENNHGNH